LETEYILFQTLQDKGNYIECESEGPFPCEWENTWLGQGYYFWYFHIDLAKWWGSSRYSKKGYVIHKSVCSDLRLCWDLHTGQHQADFIYWLKKMKISELLNSETTVAQVIEFIKNECDDFNYEAIRILGVDSISKSSANKFNLPRLSFEKPLEEKDSNKQRFLSYFDVIPPVQVCLFTKDALDRKGFEVFYPESYKKENRLDAIFI
jgi:hypothetical protein